jgi:hypothetical protein
VTGAFLSGLSAEGQCTPPDIASNASAYSTFAGVLAGFSFAALVVYLQRRPTSPGDGADARLLGSQVATGLLYSTASLIISSFLYANLISQATDFRRAAGELLIYGGVLGLSVLVMLYSLTLMIYEVPHTRGAVKYAYWLTVIAGPAVIFRFLVDAAQLVWHSGRVAKCMTAPLSGTIILWGYTGIAALLFISSLITVFGFLHWFNWTREKVQVLAGHPAIPPVTVFSTATLAAIASIAITGRASYTPARNWFTGPVLGVEFVLLAGFALACGCVIGERVPEVVPRWVGRIIGERWRQWLQDHNVNSTAILPPDNIQDLVAFRNWLAGAASTLASCRSEAHDAIFCGGAIPFKTSADLRNGLRVLDEGLRLGGSATQPGRHPGAGRTFGADADKAEAERYLRCISQLREDSTIIYEWYLWYYRTWSPSPDGMFGAIRIKRELSLRMLDDLDVVLNFIEHLQDCLYQVRTSTRHRRPQRDGGQRLIAHDALH